MATLHEFVLQYPRNLADAAALLAAPDALALAGGTDLVTNLRRGLERPATLVDLGALPGLGDITTNDGTLTLGACVTLAKLSRDPRVETQFPALCAAARSVAGPGHRSTATVGGNLCLDTRCVFYNQSEWWRRANRYCLKRGGDTCHVAPQGDHCHASFSGDLAPVLLVLGAELDIACAAGTRRMQLAGLYREDGAAHLTLARGEFVAAIRIPAPHPGLRCGYRKARTRGAIDFPLAGVAAALELDGGRIRSLRIALTGTNSRPFLLEGTRELEGKAIDAASLAKLDKLVQKQVKPMRTTVTASNYRRQVAAVLAQRLVRELLPSA
jgi:4-hydroxybenzoyl-CoA reductase subunit beta